MTAPLPRDRVAGPANPLIETPSGYRFRQLSAREWARGAHLDLDEAALAWALASESPNAIAYPQYATEIARAICRDALAEHMSVHHRITAEGSGVPGAGHYGQQSGRWCASTQWPLQAHLTIAREVLAELRPDPHMGARRWIDLRVMDRGRQGGKELAYDADSILRRRWLQGWVWVGPILTPAGDPLIDPFVLWLGRRRREGDELDPSLAMVADGRKRWRYKPPALP